MTQYKFHKEFCLKNDKIGSVAKLENILWGLKLLFNNNLPKKAFHFGGGLGDHLLCSTVFHELAQRGIKRCWMLSDYPEIFHDNPFDLKVIDNSWKTLKLLEKIKRPSTLLFYGEWIGDNDKITPPKKHIIVEILEKCGIKGNVKLRPYWYGDTSTRVLDYEGSYICVQSTRTCSSTPMSNKQWKEESLQKVVDKLSSKFRVVQLGLKKEPKLNNTFDLRGSSIFASANYLANAKFFIGQVGFLMHLARAVNTRSVIIYGGREKSWQSGYPCNENIETSPPCSPCWQNNRCDYERKCLSTITADMVLQSTDKLIGWLGEELEIEEVSIQ